MRHGKRSLRPARINFAIAVTQDDSDVFRCSGVSHPPICSYRGVALTGGMPASNPGSVIGEHVGSYRILETISSGGMGTVYRAEHTLIGKIAAVKILHPELSSNRDIVNRFFNEAKATTSIKHPGIVEVFDFGYMDSGHAYLVMEFLEGAPLARRLKQRGTLGEGEAAMILRSVCNALAAAH